VSMRHKHLNGSYIYERRTRPRARRSGKITEETMSFAHKMLYVVGCFVGMLASFHWMNMARTVQYMAVSGAATLMFTGSFLYLSLSAVINNRR
jgi:drug/metabolite transporter (DMT)-like permease